MDECTNERISESAKERVSKSANLQIGKSANQQISKSANRQVGKSANRQGGGLGRQSFQDFAGDEGGVGVWAGGEGAVLFFSASLRLGVCGLGS